jgi:hypothetical protein
MLRINHIGPKLYLACYAKPGVLWPNSSSVMPDELVIFQGEPNVSSRKPGEHTSVPSARVLKLYTVFGTVLPNRPITILPTSSPPIVMSKKTCNRFINHIKMFTFFPH